MQVAEEPQLPGPTTEEQEQEYRQVYQHVRQHPGLKGVETE